MKRKFFYHFLFLLVLFWLEASFQRVFPASFLVPQFVLVFAVVYAVNRPLKELLVMSMIAGFLGELFSGLYFGSVISALLAASLAVYFVSRSVTVQALSLSSAAFLLITVTAVFPLWIFLYNLGVSGLGLADTEPFREFYSWQLLWRAAANVIVFFPLNALFKSLFHE